METNYLNQSNQFRAAMNAAKRPAFRMQGRKTQDSTSTPTPANSRQKGTEPPSVPAPVESALLRLVQTRRIFRLYPSRNPQVQAAVSALRKVLTAFPPRKPFRLVVGSDRFLYREIPVAPGVAAKGAGENPLASSLRVSGNSTL